MSVCFYQMKRGQISRLMRKGPEEHLPIKGGKGEVAVPGAYLGKYQIVKKGVEQRKDAFNHKGGL